MKCSRKKKVQMYINLFKNNVIFYHNWLILKDFLQKMSSFESIVAGSFNLFPGTYSVIILLYNVKEDHWLFILTNHTDDV